MTNIAAITPQVVYPYSEKTSDSTSTGGVEGGDAKAQSGGTTSSVSVGVQAALGGQGASAGAGGMVGGAASSDSSNSQQSDTVKQLEDQIAQLQKQLQELQKREQQLQSSQLDDQAKASAEAALQTQITSVDSALQQAYAQLNEALQAEGSSSSGSQVNTYA